MQDVSIIEIKEKLNEYNQKFFMLVIKSNLEKNEEKREKILKEINIIRDNIEELSDKLDSLEAKRKK